MPAVLKLRFCTDEVLPASSTLFRRSTRWLLKPISPRRYQPPKSSTGAYIGGAAIGMSAANAADDSREAAPAAMRDLTLHIGFVLLAGEALCKASRLKTHGRTMPVNV